MDGWRTDTDVPVHQCGVRTHGAAWTPEGLISVIQQMLVAMPSGLAMLGILPRLVRSSRCEESRCAFSITPGRVEIEDQVLSIFLDRTCPPNQTMMITHAPVGPTGGSQ
jgi:hypothetical protein